jgi:hypothetical protein
MAMPDVPPPQDCRPIFDKPVPRSPRRPARRAPPGRPPAAQRRRAPRRGAADGYAIEDVELWAPAGQLVLQARQQRRILDGG